MPLVLTGPASAAAYFQRIDEFVGLTLGKAAQARYRIIIDDAQEVAREMVRGLTAVKQFRKGNDDAYNFNWSLRIPKDFQLPFTVTHESVAALAIHRDQPVGERAVNLRRLFSALVAANIKEFGVRQIAERGPFEIHGDRALLNPLDELLAQFVAQKRMKLTGDYKPVYRVVA